MEELTMKKKLQVLSLYFSGLSYDQIAAKAGTSKGSVTNVVNELKAGSYPETADLVDQIDALREIATDIAKLKLTVGKAAVGIAMLKRTYELNLDPADMERWPLLLSSIKTQDDAEELINAAYAVRNMQQESGMSLSALEDKVQQLGGKLKDLETVTSKIGGAKSQLKDLLENKEVLNEEVAALEQKYDWLIPRVQELEKREAGLLERHEAMLIEASEAKTTIATVNSQLKKMQKTGLSVQGLVDFNRKLEVVAKRHGIKPSFVRERLLRELRYLDKGMGIDSIVKEQRQQLKEIIQAIAKKNNDKSSLETVVADLEQQKQNLAAVIKAITEAVVNQVKHLIPVAQDTAKQIAEELKAGGQAALSEIEHLKDESIKVGQDIGQYEGILKESKWVQELTVLVQGGDDVKANDVRKIALLVNRSIATWLRQNESKSTAVASLVLDEDKILKELEEWQP